MDSSQIEENVTLEQAVRRANLLAAAAEVSQNLTRILDIDQLLPKTVDIICDAYGFYYAGVFLIDEAGEFAILRAGRGEPGRIMMENNHKLAVGGNSMIGACTARNEARISLDVDTEKVWYPNPILPDTRSEMALPLAIGKRVIGAVTVQSVEAAAFSDEDISSLQAMANQLAVAIDNAHKQRELEDAHAELIRTKTFEAIATATGDAIHWIGNKAEPISSSVERVRHDVQLLVYALINMLPDEVTHNNPLAQSLKNEAAVIEHHRPDIVERAEKLSNLSTDNVKHQLSLVSILEDLEIVDEAATLIMKVKEDLIGPAREQAPRPTMVDDVLKDAVHSIDLAPVQVTTDIQDSLPLVTADPVQLNRVFINLLKNAKESVQGQSDPQIKLTLRTDEESNFVLIDVTDNGVGIPEADIDKIWVTFHTTKSVKGHTGLGLPACRLILDQIGGEISVASEPGQGATFTVKIPVEQRKEKEVKEETGRGKVLIIDDDDHWRQFAAITLETTGFRVATSGANYSVNKFDQYDLILVDDILEARNSLEVLETVDGAGVIFKTVVVSSNPRVERTKERKLLGIHDLIPKPYTRASLVGEVKKALNAMR